MKAACARILLTGSTGGIGLAAAAALVDAGASVLLTGRSPARLSAQARTLGTRGRDAPNRVAWHAADLTDAADVARLSVVASSRAVNVVVLGAGVPSFGRLEAISPRVMQECLATNLLAPMRLTQALLPHLRQQPKAQVICIGSVLGRVGLPGYSVYGACKFGLHGFAEALRRELGDCGVRVQYLGPRSTRTSFNDAAVEAYNRATGTATDTPRVVAAALLRLLEDEAAERYVGFPERLALRLNALAPALLDRVFARHRRSLPAPLEDPDDALLPVPPNPLTTRPEVGR